MNYHFRLIVGILLVAVNISFGDFYNTDVQDQCEICKNFVRGNYQHDGIEPFIGFVGLLQKYDDHVFSIDNAEEICILTDICPSYDEPDEIYKLSVDRVAYEMTNVEATPDALQELFRIKPICYLCKKLIKWAIKKIERMHEKPEKCAILRLIAKGCKQLKPFMRAPCIQYVLNKSNKLIKGLVNNFGPQHACNSAKLC